MSARKSRERPRRRTYPDGQVRWRAQVNQDGKRVSLGTYDRRHEAQARIDEHYERGGYVKPESLGAYASTWTERHPRSERTNRTNAHRISRALELRLSGRPLADWPLSELRRKHALELAGLLLTEQGRSISGAQNILRTLSALAEDAITDELAELNPWRGVRIRQNDPRASKGRRELRVWSFADMHHLASEAGPYEPMVRVLSDCGLRLGEMLGLEHRDFDGQRLHVRGNAHDGVFTAGDAPTKKHVRSVPVPPSLAAMLSKPRDIRSPLMFPTEKFCMWRSENFRRMVWTPARKASGVDATPHEFRHSFLSAMRAAGIDQADLASVAGHSVQTANAHYVHALNRSDEQIREVVG